MSKRKPKPTHIYRVEVLDEDDPLMNSTTQQFARPFWLDGTPGGTTGAEVRERKREKPGSSDKRRKVRFWIGEIRWRPVFQSEESADDE